MTALGRMAYPPGVGDHEGMAVKPAHVAIIMDGNGRWASARGLPRTAGHRAGIEALQNTVRAAAEMGIDWLTVYAFSSENWSRPKAEISDLMGLLRHFIRRDLAELHKNGVRVRVVGSREDLDADIAAMLAEAESLTVHNEAMNLVIAFNYGGRDEIARAARAVAREAAEGRLDPATVTPEVFATHLDTYGIPDPDLVIRTSGEQRLSNFLPWQAAYSELVFLPCYWPDFGRDDLARAIEAFSARDRRFGGLTRREAVS